jgi:hypothetical protein
MQEWLEEDTTNILQTVLPKAKKQWERCVAA